METTVARRSAHYLAPRLSGALLILIAVACGSPTDTGSLVYRTVDGTELSAEVFAPPGAMRGAGFPAIVIFHGGAGYSGEPAVAHPICEYFASRGMVALSAEYRLSDEAAVTPIEAMEDAREVIAWMRRDAHRLGIDPTRIAAAGWSSGGHLAAMAAVTENDPSGTSHQPNALVLWFPSVAPQSDPDFLRLLQNRVDAATLSPAELVRPGLPPTAVFQGSRDRVAPLKDARSFCQQMEAAGNRCDLQIYNNRSHVLFHDIDDYVDTIVKADAFLASLGFLKGEADAETARRLQEESLAGP